MYFMVLQASAFLFLFNDILCYTPKDAVRIPRNIPPGDSDYQHATVDDLRTFRIQHGPSGYCLQVQGTAVKVGTCNKQSLAQKWQMMSTITYQGQIKHLQSNLCLAIKSSTDKSIVVHSCTDSAYQNMRLWGCHFAKHNKDSKWDDMDWPSLKMIHTGECLSVTSSNRVLAKTCTPHGRNNEQNIVVHEKKLMSVCAKAAHIGPRTKDKGYYYLNHPKFKITWQEKFIEFYMVYNNGVYNAFKQKYRSHDAALKKMRQHAKDTMNIVDKMYNKANIRIILKGMEVWHLGDRIPKANYSWQLHNNFRRYQFKLKDRGHKFDAALYFFDDNLFGAAGTATSHYCSGYGTFTIASLAGNDRLVPRQLANILTHEFAHHFRAGHNYDPPYSCPTYHLFGGRCTLGGNDWPKGFSSGELDNIRYYKFDCLNNKPVQSSILDCGNVKIEPGEECDCGTSQSCLKDPCCDGSICKLRRDKGAECSSESCCNNCKFDRRRQGCMGQTETRRSNYGTITEPNDNINVYRHWKIEAVPGKKLVLVMNLLRFEFEEDCPYDYLQIRDGNNGGSPILGKYCRSPESLMLESSSNSLFITYKADATFESHFSLTYTTKEVSSPDGVKEFYIKRSDGNCLKADYSNRFIEASRNCDESFVLMKTFHLKHMRSGLCIKPSDWYGSYHQWADLKLQTDCSSLGGVFLPTSQPSMQHAISSMCIYWSYGRAKISRCTYSRQQTQFKLVSASNVATTPPPITTSPPRPPVSGILRIRHYSNLCLSYSHTDQRLHLTKACDDYFYLDNNKYLHHSKLQKCVVPVGLGDNSLLTLDKCTHNARFEATSSKSIKHLSTGKCWHPLNGATYPKENTQVVIYRGCQEGNRIQFRLEKVVPKQQTFLIRHSGGLCVSVRYDNRLYLTNTCTTKFTLTQNKAIKHATTGNCVVPESRNNDAFVKLQNDCNDSNARFEQTAMFSAKHLATGKCMHPFRGSSRPADGTLVVIYSGCNEKRLQFKFE